MKKLFLAIIALFFGSANAASPSLVEFSTSMDFEEFKVVLKNLSTIDKSLAGEIAKNISAFKNSSTPGQIQKFELNTVFGYITLEREDNYAFAIYTFTSQETNSKIDTGYERGTKELGI